MGFLYGLALRWRLTAVGRDLHLLAQRNHAALRCGPRGIRITHGSREIWFRNEDATLAWAALTNLASFQRRLFFKTVGTREVADCRGLREYRLPGVDDTVQLPVPPEPSDIVSGYFAKGEPREGALAFDAGAFCGELTLVLARKVGPRGRVVAFEPDAGNRAWLQRNVERAGFKNVTVIDRGLWSETTRLRFAGNQGWLSKLDPTGTAANTVEIPVVGFEEACRLAGGVPDFVKMDIEGAEVEALEGSFDFVRAQRIHFAIASYHDRGGQPSSALLEPLFRKAGYEVETGFPEHPTTWAWKR
jgi:FkbM family methyltransferase